MPNAVLAVPFWLELAAALTGGLAGAMSAVRARYDIFGTVCIACTCGLLGGVIRDVLLQNFGIYAFQKPTLILACVIAGVIVFFFGKLATYLNPIVDLLDNISVALWAVLSVGKGLSAGLDIIPSVILGTVTAVGGGIMRDVFMNREPEAFQAGTLYGSAALVGSTVFALMKQNHLLEQWAPLACVALVLALRYASLLFGWRTKPPRDYSDVVTKAVARPVRSVARRVRPPKGKIEREKEKELQKSGKLIRLRKHRGGADQPAHTRSEGPSDPSDRILVKDLSEIRDEAAAEPKDPFEPQTPIPKK